MSTPKITPAQVIGILAVAGAVALSHLGWMTTDQFFGVCAAAGVLKLSDAGLRVGRNVNVAAQANLAAAQIAASVPDVPQAKP